MTALRCGSLLRCVGLLAALATLGGCASVRVDEQGRTHIAGLVWMTLPAPALRDQGADQIRTRSIGLTLARLPLGQSLVLGYSDHTLTRIENDSAVRLPPHSD